MENTEDGKPGESFLSWAHKSHPPKSGENCGEKTQKSGLMEFLHKCPLESS